LKTVTAPTLDNITNGYVNQVGVVVRAEWLHNRFYRTVVDNTPSEDTDGYDIELFPIESITKQNRPKSGINKAIVNQAFAQPEYHDSVPAARYYMCSTEDQYKYWQSPLISGASSPYTMTNCAPQVLYVEEDDVSGAPVPRTVLTNKIHYTIENTYAYPTSYNVQVKATGASSWTTVSSNIAIPSNGKIELWYNGSTWTTTPDYTHTTTLHAVRLVINSMNKQAYFNLIELGLALELDVSADVTDIQAGHSMGEADFITPLGNISSNNGSITLFNETRKYSDDNPSSILYGLLDKGVIFRAWYKYGTESIQELTMVSDSWTEDVSDTSVALVDNTTVFMETKPRPVLYQNMPVQEVVWRICDMIGFTDYNVTALDLEPHSVIDIFWTDGEKTAWEVFGDLARATQTAIYFDSFGNLNVRTRGAAWDDTKPVAFNFIRDTVPGGQPSNIVELTEKTDYEANKVTVNWKPTGFSEVRDNIIPFEIVWQPDSDIVLRASELIQPMVAGSTWITLSQRDGSTWPFKGICNIVGEWVEYEGKNYIYYEGSTRKSAVVTTLEQQQRLDATTGAFYRHLNQYTGHLKIKTRGLYNTQQTDHNIALTGWTKTRRKNYSTIVSPTSGIGLVPGTSTVSIECLNNESTYSYLHRGNGSDDGYYYLGTRIRIDKTSHQSKIGGIFFNSGALGAGYYVEVTATASFNSKMRASKNEIVFYSMKTDGTKKQIGGERVVLRDRSRTSGAGKKIDIGSEFAVPMGTFIDLDIIYTPGTNDKVQIWANGQFLFESIITAASGWKQPKVSRFGLYARGYSKVSFDYVYAVTNFYGPSPLDDESYLDRIEGGYRGDMWQRDWTYEWRTVRKKVKRKWTKIQQRYNQRFFDEFGPIAHEIRKFDVKFTNETPSLQSKLYFSNTTQAICTEFWSDPKSAHFYMANASRENAVLSGDDSLTAGGFGTINHKMFVYGRPVIQKDAQQIVKTDDWAIRRRGTIEVEYDSQWIQNESEADRLADWLTTHWTRSDSTLDVEVFGNPLIELCDVVHVNYLDIDANYYVTEINNSFSEGLTTTLTLRRVT
jgi:hypothetical protein